MSSSSSSSSARLVILYGIGGLSDVGRHAIRAALDQPSVSHICVLTQHPQLLDMPNWKCGCPEPHVFTDEERKRLEIVPVQSWQDDDNNNDKKEKAILEHFADATAVISCLGNRQPGLSEPELKQGWVSYAGNQLVVKAMEKYPRLGRVVVMSSVGVAEDWPPMEFFWPAKVILGAMFVIPGLAKRAYQDLTQMEELYKATAADAVDYLLVRPMGLGDDVVPVGTWQLQKQKHVDTVGIDMAKMDCARFMVQEALNPTLHRTAVVIGSVEETTSPSSDGPGKPAESF